MTERFTIRLPWPEKALHSNARAHHMVKHRAAKSARHDAWWACKDVGLPSMPNAEILIEYWPPSYRGDIHNVASSCKAYIDGIAQAMGCDDKGFTVDYPTVWAGKKPGGEMVFHVVGQVE